jgi:hypothetical protein
MAKHPKRPRDPNQWAKLIVDLATSNATEAASIDTQKDPNAAALGRKGGEARAKKLSAKKRTEIARKAARKRWKK